jgi:uncharacterized protein YwbE
MHFPMRRILIKVIDVFPCDGKVIKKEQIDPSVRVSIQVIHKELDVLDPVAKDGEGTTKTVDGIKGMSHPNGIKLQLDTGMETGML